jgi:hypothetical protein
MPITETVRISLPDSSFMEATHSAILDLPNIPISASMVYLFPKLAGSLISVSQLCDAGFTVLFTISEVIVKNAENIVVLNGRRTGSLYTVTPDSVHPEAHSNSRIVGINSHLLDSCNRVIRHDSQAERVAFYHAAMGSPSIPTFIAAIRRGYVVLPGLSADMIKKNLPNPIATSLGHLDALRRGLRSTKQPLVLDAADEEDPNYIPTPEDRADTQPLGIICREFATAKLFVDATGRFPVTSRSGTQYMLVFYSESTNYIHIEKLPNRQGPTYLTAYKRAVNFFQQHQIPITDICLDNETSGEVKTYLKTLGTVRFVPPRQHRTNKAERAIRTWKNHFVSTLFTSDPDFPLDLMDYFIDQAEITINLLRASAITPCISAYQQVRGVFDYCAHPFAPLGTKVVVFESPEQRQSWGAHGVEGWYIGPALDHYRCFAVYVNYTNAVRITDTVAWHPIAYVMPDASGLEALTILTKELVTTLKALQDTPPTWFNSGQPASAHINTSMHEAMQVLRELFPMSSANTNGLQRTDTTLDAQVTDHRSQRVETPTDVPINGDASQRVNQGPEPRTTPLPHPHHQAPVRTRAQRRAAHRAIYLLRQADITTDDTPVITVNHYGRSLYPMTPQRAQGLQRAYTAVDMDSAGAVLKYKAALKTTDKLQWESAACDEFRRLIKSGTGKFISHDALPRTRRASYYNPVIKSKTDDKTGIRTFRVRGTFGGDLLTDYPGEITANTADLTTIKILLNATISDASSSWSTLDIKDYYLNTPLKRKEYMVIHKSQIPDAFFLEYPNVATLVNAKGFYLMEISKGIYGLPQAGKLAQDRLIQHIATFGYHPVPHTPCLFRHESRPIMFSLVVDDFGVKYSGGEHLQHLIDTLRELYELHVDIEGAKYVGLDILFDRTAKTVSISMQDYVQRALLRFGATDIKGVNSPGVYIPPNYGAAVQYNTVDNSPLISEARISRIRAIVGVFQWYARGVDPTLLPSLSIIASRQHAATEEVDKMVSRLLAYVRRHPNAKIIYHASDMQVCAHSDASYLSESKSRSRAGGIAFFGYLADGKTPNGAIECVSTIIECVLASVGEAEYAALFKVAQVCENIRSICHDIGYPQNATPIVCDNTCAVGIANDTCKLKRLKAIDMRFHWVRDRVRMGHFIIAWKPGSDNLADFFTKPLAVYKHIACKHLYVHSPAVTDT